MDERGELPDEDSMTVSLREQRPREQDVSSLERRLAMAAILDAADGGAGAPPEPQRIGRLEVQSKIGGGGMGVVYRAWDPVLERMVAVKVLRGVIGEPMRAAERRARMADEARALARLSHPNVVTVFDVVHDAGELCFVMEFVAGRTLREWLDANPSAAWQEVVERFIQVGHGVAAAHAAGIVHQDLKPENVLVGDDGRARVVDFGLARWHGDDGAGGIAGGTPHYMAPEVAARRPATPLSDQYSFCVALKDALANRDAPDALSTAIARGLSTEPFARHASFAALLAVLSDAVAGAVADRTRRLLIERVERLWLRGVLERSLDGGAVVDLALRSAPELVDPPWQKWGVDTDVASTRAGQLGAVLRAAHGSLLLVGPPGSGKTTSLLMLARELSRAALRDPEEPVPVVLSLSSYEPEERADRALSAHFAAWVIDELVAKYGLPRPAARRLVDAHAIALLLDGLDESDARFRGRVIDTLNQFLRDQPLPMVVSCRDDEYGALGPRLAFGAALAVQPLDDSAVARIIESRPAGHRPTGLALDRKVIEGWDLPMRNPLLLTLWASDAVASPDGEPPAWGRAYERYIDRAFAKTSLSERAVMERQLGVLARAMRRHSTSDLWLERLHFGWLERRWEQIGAYVVGVLLVLAFGIGLNAAQVPLTGNSLPSALIFGVGVSVSSFAYTRGRIRPVESLRWSWRRMLRLLPVTTACATVVGLAEALRMNFWANLVGAGITGAILAVTFALDAGDREGKVRPNAGIHRSLAFALVTSFGFAIPVGLFFGLIVNPYIRRPLIASPEGTGNQELMVGVSVGLFVFTALFLIYGGFTALMHYVLRVALALRTPLPLALQRTLDRAVELRLMRRVGGGWVFIHHTLLDHFADQRPSSVTKSSAAT